MDSTTQQWNFTEGTDVVGSDGDKVGEIVAVQPNYIVVEKGFFFPTDYYIPTSAIANYDGDRVYLNVTKDEALSQGWDTMPTEDTGFVGETATVGSTYSTDMGATDVTARDAGTYVGTTTGTYGGADTGAYAAATDVTRMEEGERLRIPVHEEELAARTREREIGEVRIEKDVVAEERVLEVPVTEERVRVQRHVVDQEVDPNAATFQEGVIEVPVRGEEVELEKRVRVAEELEIAKEQVQRTEQVAGTVRREVVDVTQDVVDTAEATAQYGYDTARTTASTAAGMTAGMAGTTGVAAGDIMDRGRGTGDVADEAADTLGDALRGAGQSARDAVTGDDAGSRGGSR